jgi:LysM repeat protein
LSLLIVALLSACVQVTAEPVHFPTYDPFLPLPSNTPGAHSVPNAAGTTISQPPTATREPTPTRVPLSVSPPPTTDPGLTTQMIVDTATPDVARVLPTPRQDSDQYMVQAGDTLGIIAQNYGISIENLMQANNIADPNLLEVGMSLNVPAPNPVGAGSGFKVIPDSELVYSPASVYFNIQNFIESQNGYLETYEQDVNDVTLAGYEIVGLVARNYSVNPRLLLALLEYQSGWVTNPDPFNTSYPMGLLDENHYGLYRQLTWTADTLNRGYYLWKVNALSTFVMSDGSVAPINPTINAGTAAVQYFFSELDDRATWEKDVSGTGLLLTYFVFFGNPFNFTIEPLVSPSMTQPKMILPFGAKEAWYFTGGPHGGWDSGSAWAALDFAPPGDNNGSCEASASWATAVADGLILRASNGAVIQDLDNDGYEQTGWVILYMHIASAGRVGQGEYLFAGERVGHPSCEGGVSNATHLHIARKYNGEWIAADGLIPFNLDGWVSSGDGREYDGFLTRGNVTIEAFDSANDFNQVRR